MKACGITDVGLQRHENQDAFAIERGAADGQLVAVVCDGMGGESCGHIASSLALHAFLDALRTVLREGMNAEQLREAASFCVAKANAAVNLHAQEHSECRGMGTTLVCAVTYDGGAVVCNVGDSRAYRVSASGIEQITRDHSVVEGLLESGNITAEQARTHPKRNLITRALGPETAISCDVFDTALAPQEWLLLCSDGLVVTVTDEEMRAAVMDAETPAESLERLLTLSKQRGAPDNITAVLLYHEEGKEGDHGSDDRQNAG